MQNGIISFGILDLPDNHLGECIPLESIEVKDPKPVADRTSGLLLNLVVYKPCACNFSCDVEATLNGQQIAVNGISFDIRKADKA